MNKQDERNQEQFLKLLMQNDKVIYAYILSLVYNTNDADDIMQEASAVMWRKFAELEPGRDFVPWALSVARFQVLNFLKKRKRSRIVFSDDLIESIEKQVEQKLPKMNDRLVALKDCVKKLDTEDQKMIRLRYEQGCTLKSVGDKVSRSTRATFYSLSRIHQLLEQCIKKTLREGVIHG